MKHPRLIRLFAAALYTCALSVLLGGAQGWAEDGHEHGHGHEEHEAGAEEGHDDHEEGDVKTTLSPEASKRAGIVTAKVGPATISEKAYLTGKVILNQDKTYDIRARFPGIVREVAVSWTQSVREGDLLAKVESNESLRVYDILAPVSGVIIKRNTNVGNVTGDEPIFTIADLSTVWVEFHVFPRDLPRVHAGQEVHVRTLENGHEDSVRIDTVLPMADSLSQTAIALVSLDNTGHKWRPGMTVEADVHVLEKRVPIAVERSAIQRMDNQQVVFIREGDTYHARPIHLGDGDGQFVEVTAGLQANEEYVAEGSFIVKADILKSTAEHSH